MSLSSNNEAQAFDSGHYFIHLILLQKKIQIAWLFDVLEVEN